MALVAHCPAQQTSAPVAEQMSYEKAMNAAESRMADPTTAAEARASEKRLAIEGALALRKDRQFEHALSLLLRATAHDPEDAEILRDTALLEDEMHLYVDAEAAVLAARKLAPQEPTAMYAEARIEMDLGKLPEAEAAMTAYLNLRPDDASAHYGLARMYRSELRNEQAEAELKRSLALQPRQAESNYQLGELALERGHPQQATAFYDGALAVDPLHAGALTGKAILAYRRRDYTGADVLLASAERSAPDFQAAHYYRGLVLARLGRKQEADAEFALSTQLLDAQKNNKGLRLATHP